MRLGGIYDLIVLDCWGYGGCGEGVFYERIVSFEKKVILVSF